MKQPCIFVLALSAFTLGVFGQAGVPVIKARVMSAFVWAEDSTSGAISSTIQDPLTGNVIHTLSYAGIEDSSRIGFERVSTAEVGHFPQLYDDRRQQQRVKALCAIWWNQC